MSEPLLHWIDGEPVASADETTHTFTDPSTGRPGTRVSLGTAADADRAVRAAHRARASWRHTGSLDRNDTRIAREEIFGPVLVVIPFDTEEAVDLANDSDYGLTGGVFTADMSRAIRVAEAIEAGQVSR